MTNDWREHNGGPRPVANGTWVRRFYRNYPGEPFRSGPQLTGPHDNWKDVREYEVLNQHLIDAARLEGIRLGLEAAAKVAEEESGNLSTTARVLQSFGSRSSATVLFTDKGFGSAIRNLNPDTIAKEADNEPR